MLIFLGLWIITSFIAFGFLNGNSIAFVDQLFEKYPSNDIQTKQDYYNKWYNNSIVMSIIPFASFISALFIYFCSSHKGQKFTIYKKYV